ncbi:MAG: S1 RNA-binding domain-containing protein [SAR202 cluster bacterium]|nr:S1 RNA-binding domain-containing protein [SAR202 cluster bacterium]
MSEVQTENDQPNSETDSKTTSQDSPENIAASTDSSDNNNQIGTAISTEKTSMDELIEEFLPHKPLKRGEIIDGKIMSINDNGLLIDIGYKSEGFIPTREMKTLVSEEDKEINVGDEVIAYVVNPETNSGSSVLSIDRARGEQGWRILEKAMQNDQSCYGVILSANRGGAVVESEGVQGFIPLSQLVGPSRELFVNGGEPPKDGFIGMKIQFKIIELNRRRNRAIFSERVALEAERQVLKKKLLNTLKEGDVIKGRIVGVSNFGAFVDLGGADGLIHISELSWGPVKNPEDFVTVGTDMDVYVLKIDRETLKIALSLRRLTPEPWEQIQSGLEIGQTVTGTITKLANFGAFARIEPGVEGLIHISELSYDVVKHPKNVVSEGDKLDLQIIRIEPDRKRLGLSIKRLSDPPEGYEEPKNDEISDELNEHDLEKTDINADNSEDIKVD